jgi:hypothetical protein
MGMARVEVLDTPAEAAVTITAMGAPGTESKPLLLLLLMHLA